MLRLSLGLSGAVLIGLTSIACQHNPSPAPALSWNGNPRCTSANQQSMASQDSVARAISQAFGRLGFPATQSTEAPGTIVVTGGPSAYPAATKVGLPATFMLVGRISGSADTTTYQLDVRSAEIHGGRFTSTDSAAVRNFVVEVCIKAGSSVKSNS